MTAPVYLTASAPTSTSPALAGSADPGCPACGHTAEAHGPVGVRFCRATTTGGLDRGCVCRGD